METEKELEKESDVVNIPTEEEIDQYNMRTMSETGDETPVENDLTKYDLPKNRRNKTMRYGLKEVADVIFFDVGTKRPVLIFDTSK